MKRDRVTAIISIVLGLIVAGATYVMPESHMAGDVGPKLFPGICAAGLLLSGLILLIREPAHVFKENYSKPEFIRLAKIFGVVLLYTAAMDLIGFAIPTIAVLFIICSMFAKGLNVPLWKRVLFAIAITAVIYVAFEKVMVLQLPDGRLFA